MAGYYNRGFVSGSDRGGNSSYYRGGGSYSGGMRSFRKRSGCSIKRADGGRVFLYGWRLSRGSFFSFTASETKKSKDFKSKSGKTWRTLLVVITNKSTFQKVFCSGLYDVQRERLYIKDYNLIANPSAPNGGYFGQHLRREYSR